MTASVALCVTVGVAGCGDDSTGRDSATAGSTSDGSTAGTSAGSTATDASASTDVATESGSAGTDTGASTSAGSTAGTTASTTTASTGTTAGTDTEGTSVGTTAGACDECVEPNQACVDDQCVTLCQGQDPDPCGPDQVCDVKSGECKDPGSLCTIAGATEVCGDRTCGPGTVCDGVGECLPVAPCAAVICTSEGDCWGEDCSCDRVKECDEAPVDLLNGPFSEKIAGIDFADDCTAWMVTLRDGTDYLRRLTPDGTLTEWPGVSNLDMGEVKVLRRLTIPQRKAAPGFTAATPPPPEPVEGYGEVALSYICCANCGCAQNPPQGVARLVEEDMNNPLAIVIVATTTQGVGPFGSKLFDAGPQGLAWGEDRIFYVGESTEPDNLLKLRDFLTGACARTASVTRLAA
ncbi:MAG: hypothetical protein R3B09_00390 [Nannocystaceae bacterium]